MALDDLLQKANALRNFDTETEVQRIVSDNSERITELQQEQLAAGIGKDGRKRIDEYAALTVYLKKTYGFGLGAETDRVTFFSTGQLYGSLRTQVMKTTYKTTSPLETFTKMVDRIGEDNYGLSPDQAEEMATGTVIPLFVKKIENILK